MNKIMKNYAEHKSFYLVERTRSEQQMDFLLLFECFSYFFSLSHFLALVVLVFRKNSTSYESFLPLVRVFPLFVFSRTLCFGFRLFAIRSRRERKRGAALLLDDSILFRLFMIKYS